MGVARGTLVLSGDEQRGYTAGIYLGEDPDGTGLWAPIGTVEKIEPGDFDSAPDDFSLAVNKGAQVDETSEAERTSIVGGVEPQPGA